MKNKKLITALCLVVDEYFPYEGENLRAHKNMSSGEFVCDILEELGLAKDTGYCIEINDKFKKILEDIDENN